VVLDDIDLRLWSLNARQDLYGNEIIRFEKSSQEFSIHNKKQGGKDSPCPKIDI
jgi:hypothetical protein